MDTATVSIVPGIDRESRQRRYTPDDIADALAALAANNGSIAATSREKGIPEQTIRNWRDETVSVPSPEVVNKEKVRRAAKWDEVQDAAVDQVLARLPEASARDAAVVAGIAVDKAALLRGESGPVADPETLARLELFRARYAQAQQLHVHLHAAPTVAPPTAPAPLVLDAKTTGIVGEGETPT